MTNLKARGVVAATIVSLLATASPAVVAQELTALTMALPGTTCLGNFPVYVAQQRGYFADEGLTVQPQGVNGSTSVIQAVVAGQAQFGSAGPLPVLNAWDRGEKIKFIANLKPRIGFALITPEDKKIGSIEELRGKTIGAATVDGNEVSFLKQAMAVGNLSTPADYKVLVVGDGGPAVAAFLRGDIDAFAASVSDWAIISNAGLPMQNITPEESKAMLGNGLVATAAYVEANPEIVERFGRALRRAVDLAMTDSAQVIEDCRAYNPQEVEDPNYANALMAAWLPIFQTLGDDAWGYQRPDNWETLKAGLVAEGDFKGTSFELSDVYTNDFVEAFNK